VWLLSFNVTKKRHFQGS